MNFIEKLKNYIRQLLNWLAKNNGLIIITWLVLGFIIWLARKSNILTDEWLDVSIFAAMILTLLCDRIVTNVQKWIFNKYEDRNKLTIDYKNLTKMYPLSQSQMIKYDNHNIDPQNLKYLLKKEKVKHKNEKTNYPVIFPVTLESETYKVPLEFHDSPNKYYEAPTIAKQHFDELMQAHNSSDIYNQMNIRVDNWCKKNGKFHIYTSRTTYFDSLITNRSIDYKLKNGMTLRNFFGFGPVLSPLKSSKLSNHLGFNGFIESSDGYIPLILRAKNLSVGKNTYSDSISASLKYRYVFEHEKKLNSKGVENAILSEIKDEIKLSPDELEWKKLPHHIIATYRDIIEGGKPHFLFYAKSKLTKSQIEAKFKNSSKNHKKRLKKAKDTEASVLQDGTAILWLHRDNLSKIAINSGYIIYNQKTYKMTPSASACLVMLKDFLQKTQK